MIVVLLSADARWDPSESKWDFWGAT